MASFYTAAAAQRMGGMGLPAAAPSKPPSSRILRFYAWLTDPSVAPIVSAAGKVTAFVGAIVLVRKFGDLLVWAPWFEGMPPPPPPNAFGPAAPTAPGGAMPLTM